MACRPPRRPGRRLSPGLRPPGDPRGLRVPPGRDSRGGGPAGDDQGRCLLPVLHLPSAAVGDRTRPVGTARLPLRPPLSLHLRRHPESVRHLEAAVPRRLRAVSRPAPGPRPATAVEFWDGELRHLVKDLSAVSGRNVTDGGCLGGDRAPRRGAPGHPGALPGSAGTAVGRADRGALPAAPGRRSGARRGVPHPGARIPGRGRGRLRVVPATTAG